MAEQGPTVVIAVGDELLSGHTLDTNSNLLAARAFETGWPVRRIEAVADDNEAIAAAIRRALAADGVLRVVVCGGIGPTPDDHTFEAVAEALGRPLEVNPEALAHISAIVGRMHAAGWVDTPEVSEANRRAASMPAGAQLVTNRRGMTPAIAIALEDDRVLFVLPGVPREFATIVDEELIPRFFTGGRPAAVVEVIYTSVPEAEMYEPMLRLAREFPDVHIGSYPQSERRQLVIRLSANDQSRLDEAASRLRELRADAR
ncbi:MAG TPA: molybdopterin-binding protein [Candidatus Dormibacteraeota bacterium]|nr:molybdopterin-binding protein [Candidatus Dormibacteraeota bacterium]